MNGREVGKPIRLSEHARDQLRYRGATDVEIIDAIRTEPWGDAERGRLECRKTYAFGADWNGRIYSNKQVRPIFVDEPGEIVVVTAYVYYF